MNDELKRIEADERAVPVAWRYRLVAPNGNRGEWFVTQDEPSFERSVSIERQPLFTHPPAQAAQRCTVCGRAMDASCAGLDGKGLGCTNGAPTAEPVAQCAAHLYEYCDAEIQLCIEYSHNYATARPDTPVVVKEHILGLCERLQSVLADRKRATHPHSPDAADSGRVTDAFAVLEKLGWEWVGDRWMCGDIADPSDAALAAQGQGWVVYQVRSQSIQAGWSEWADITKEHFDSLNAAIARGACSQTRVLYTALAQFATLAKGEEEMKYTPEHVELVAARMRVANLDELDTERMLKAYAATLRQSARVDDSLWPVVDRMIVDAWKLGGCEKSLDMLAMRARFEVALSATPEGGEVE